MSFLDLIRGRKGLDEVRRREMLLRKGRIADGIITDQTLNPQGEPLEIFYAYSVRGTEYHASQKLNEEQRIRLIDYAPGAHVTVRYDPHNPSNSIVV